MKIEIHEEEDLTKIGSRSFKKRINNFDKLDSTIKVMS